MGVYGRRGIVYHIYCKLEISKELFHEIMKTMILDFEKKNFRFDKDTNCFSVISIEESHDRFVNSSCHKKLGYSFFISLKHDVSFLENIIEDICLSEKEKLMVSFIKEKLGNNFDKEGWWYVKNNTNYDEL